MGSGLLAWWHRRIASFGVAGTALFLVPVAVAAMIGLATGLSGIASGLTSLTSGPDTVPASAQGGSPQAAAEGSWELVSKSAFTVGSNSGGGSGAIDPASGNTGNVKVLRTGGSGDAGGGSATSTVSGPGSTGGSGGSGGSGGGSSGPSIPSSPNVNVPGLGGVDDTLNNTVNGVNGTVNETVQGVNDTVGGVGNTVDGLLNP
jgi:hypothetical protein